MTERELCQWSHYLQRDPPVGERLEFMLAMLCAVTLNATGRMKRPAKAEDFLPKWGPKKKQTVEDMVGRFKAALEIAKARKAVEKKKAEARLRRTQEREARARAGGNKKG